jgi:hypothetical protein
MMNSNSYANSTRMHFTFLPSFFHKGWHIHSFKHIYMSKNPSIGCFFYTVLKINYHLELYYLPPPTIRGILSSSIQTFLLYLQIPNNSKEPNLSYSTCMFTFRQLERFTMTYLEWEQNQHTYSGWQGGYTLSDVRIGFAMFFVCVWN